MKRLYLTFLLTFATLLSLRAQMPAEFRFHGQPLENGAIVTLDMEEDPFGIEPPFYASNPSGNPAEGLVLVNLTDAEIKSGAQLSVSQNTLTDQPLQWCMGGLCETFTATKYSKDYTLPAGGQVLVQFDVHPTREGTFEATITTMIQLRSISVTVRCSNEAARTWWGNYSIGDAFLPFGAGDKASYDCATLFSTARAELDGATIHGVRFLLADKTNISGVKVWLSTTRPASAEQADIACVAVDKEALADAIHDDQMCEVLLPTPHKVESDIWVGYSFVVDKVESAFDRAPGFYTNSRTANGLWLRVSGTAWQNYTSFYGDLVAQVLISNPSLPTNAVQLASLEKSVGVKAQTATVTVNLTKQGLAAVSNLDYIIAVDGTAQPLRHYDLPNPVSVYGRSFSFPAEISVPDAVGVHSYSVQIVQVNNQPNAGKAVSLSGSLLALEHSAQRRSVVEEYTGTWCGYCPRGMVGMANLQRDFGDNFIGIAIHNKDAMAQDVFNPIMASSFPTCNIDRTLLGIDPYGGSVKGRHYTIDDDFRQAVSQPSEAELSLTAVWADKAQTKVELFPTATFLYGTDAATYGLAYFLTADSLTGTGDGWIQENYFTDGSYTDEDMAYYSTAPSKISGLYFNHVAVAGHAVSQGEPLPATIVSGQPLQTSQIIELSSSVQQLVADSKDKMHGVVLLIDTASGKVVNAAQTSVLPFGMLNGVASVSSADDSLPVCYYTIDGRRLSQPQRGLNILRRADGTVQKVFVR